MRRGLVASFLAAVLGIALGSPGLAQIPMLPPLAPQQVILSLGNDQFVPRATIEVTTGARIQSDFRGLRFLDEVSVIILADMPFAQLPPLLQTSLTQWVELGGSLLVTGGNSAFGSGGYAGTALGTILPLQPISSDRTQHTFSPTYVLNPSHPIFTGVTTTTMANFNETTVAGDASLLLEYRGVSKGGAVGAGLTGSGRPFTTTTTTTVQTPGGAAFASPGATGTRTQSSVAVLGPAIKSGVAGTPGVGGQGTVPVPNIASGTAVASLPTSTTGAPVTTGGTVITPGSGGYGTAVGQPTPLQPAAPTATSTPGVLANPVLPTGGSLGAGGIPPGSAIVTQPGPGGTVTVTQTTGLPGQNLLQADPGFATEGGLQGGGHAAIPLVAERRQGSGTVLAIALDMNATGEWQDRYTLTINAVRYLLEQSKLPKR
jgi:hypothetical protein